MTGLMLGALLGGLAGSPHCVGMCGGFAAAAADHPVAYPLGRLTTYAMLGAVAGTVGVAIPGPPWVSALVSMAMLTYFSLRLADLVPAPRIGTGRLVRAGADVLRRQSWGGRFALGAVTALLPCGLVWAAMGLAIGGNGPGGGALIMAAFWVGTVPLPTLATLGFGAMIRRSSRARVGMAALVFLAGTWSVLQRAPGAASVGDGPPTCHPGE